MNQYSDHRMLIMFCTHRYLRRLKKMVGNRSRVEGSICSAYLTQETTTFCSYYFDQHIAEQFRPSKRNVVDNLLEGVDMNDLPIFTEPGMTVGRSVRRPLTDSEYHVMQTYVLCNCAEIEPYIE